MTSRTRPLASTWAPPPEDKIAPPATLPADFAGWDDAEAPTAPAKKAPPRVPSWQEAIFPNRTAAGGNIAPLGLTALGASAKDLAALPVNVAAGLMNMINYPMQQSVGFRRGMAGVESDAMPQNERAVFGLSMAGGPLGKIAEASVPVARATAPLAKGLANIGRGIFGGAAESVPAAAYQAATGDGSGSLANLALGGAFGGGMRTVGLAPKAIDKAAGSTARSMSGLPEKDLRKIGFLGNSKYGKKVLAVAGNRVPLLNKLGAELIDRAVVNFDAYLPDAAKVDAIIAGLPPIDGKRIIAALERAKPPVKSTPESRAGMAGIDDLISIASESMDANGMIPANIARQIRQGYDASIGDAWGKQTKSYITALKNGRHEIAQALEDVAKDKPEYAQAMRDYTKAYRARDRVFQELGNDQDTQEKRVESFLSNLFQGNKAEKQARFRELSDLLGEDFAERAKILSDAKRIAPEGDIPLISAHNTGKAGMGGSLVGGVGGLGFGLATGNPALIAASVGSLGLSTLASPALAPGLLGVTDRVARMAANPVAGSLARTAGRSGRAYLQSQIAGE